MKTRSKPKSILRRLGIAALILSLKLVAFREWVFRQLVSYERIGKAFGVDPSLHDYSGIGFVSVGLLYLQ